MQQIDVKAIGFIRQIGRNPDRKTLSMRGAGGAVSGEPGQLALALDDLGVGGENFCKLAVKADADVVSELGMLGHQSPGGAHNEFEMSDVVSLLRSDHQEIVLVARPAVQAVPSVEHEDLERGDTIVESKVLHLVDMPRLDRGNVITIVDPKSSIGLLERFGHE